MTTGVGTTISELKEIIAEKAEELGADAVMEYHVTPLEKYLVAEGEAVKYRNGSVGKGGDSWRRVR